MQRSLFPYFSHQSPDICPSDGVVLGFTSKCMEKNISFIIYILSTLIRKKNASNLCFCRKICTTFTFCYQCFKFSKLNFYVWQPGIVHIFSEGISILEPFGQLCIWQLRWIWAIMGMSFLHFEVALELDWTVFCTGQNTGQYSAQEQNTGQKSRIFAERKIFCRLAVSKLRPD